MSTAPALVNETEELSCVMIPTSGVRLLLPNVSIAEILPWRRMKPLQQGPAWCLGHVGWRGRTVPVVSYAGFAPETANTKPTARCLVIMNRAKTVSGPAFYALAAEGLPRMLQLADDDVDNVDAELGPADIMHVSVGTENAIIPDLGYIEQHLSELGED